MTEDFPNDGWLDALLARSEREGDTYWGDPIDLERLPKPPHKADPTFGLTRGAGIELVPRIFQEHGIQSDLGTLTPCHLNFAEKISKTKDCFFVFCNVASRDRLTGIIKVQEDVSQTTRRYHETEAIRLHKCFSLPASRCAERF
jgi:hypothetical protein